MTNLRNICDILNLDYKFIRMIFERHMTNKFDNLIIDKTRPDKKVRKNFTEVIQI